MALYDVDLYDDPTTLYDETVPTDGRIGLSCTGLPDVPGMAFYVERRVPGGNWELVRGGAPAPVSGGALSLFDYEYIPNVLNEYRTRSDAMYDNFTRVTASSWGVATSGGSGYSLSGGVSNFATNGSVGNITLNATDTRYLATPIMGFTLTDVDITVDVGVSATALTQPIGARVVTRRADLNNYYYAEVQFLTTGLVQFSLNKRVGGTETTLATYTTLFPYAPTPTTTFRVKLRVLGNRLTAKIWAVSDEEPELFQLGAVDNSLPTTGSPGVSAIAYSGNTNVAPVVHFDNLHIGDLATINPRYAVFCQSETVPEQHSVWLKFPLRPFLNREVTLCNWSEETIPGRGRVFEVLGRRLPVAATDIRGSRRFNAIIKAADSAEAEAIRYALSFGDVVFLQTPGPETYCALARRNYPELGYFNIEETTYARVLDGVATQTIDLPMVEVAAPDASLEATSVTWQGIVNAFATWADVVSQFGNWNDVMAYISAPEDEEVG